MHPELAVSWDYNKSTLILNQNVSAPYNLASKTINRSNTLLKPHPPLVLSTRAHFQGTCTWFSCYVPPPCSRGLCRTSCSSSTRMSSKWRCRVIMAHVFLKIPGYSNITYFYQVVMLSSVTELHAYIDPGQLTRELGGTQEFCHDSWISHRTVCTHTLCVCL